MTQPQAPPPKEHHCNKCKRSVGAWKAQCPKCGAFNSIVAGAPPGGPRAYGDDVPQLITEVKADSHTRLSTGTREFDRVLGGGIVVGSVVLLAGDPGIGKSTLLNQTGSDMTTAEIVDVKTGKPAESLTGLYVVAEETPGQVAGRQKRLGLEAGKLYLYYQANVHEIDKEILRLKPDFVFIDSVQKMFRPDVQGTPGSVAQVRESSDFLITSCKNRGIALIIVCHITKDDAIAGPKTLEHAVDAVLKFGQEGHSEQRSLIAEKNRFGATSEMALFRMTSTGLVSIENPSELLVAHHKEDEDGSCLGVTMRGSRAVVVEAQAILSSIVPLGFESELESLTDASAREVIKIFNALKRLQKPQKRNVTGVPAKRVNQMLAVLARRIGLDVREEVWVNVAGGFDFEDPGLDLPIALALASAAQGRALPPGFAAFGEVGLLGEIRPVDHMDVRIKQAAMMGYKSIMGPVAPSYDDGDEEGDEEAAEEALAAGLPEGLARSEPPEAHGEPEATEVTTDDGFEEDDDDDLDDEGSPDGKDRYIEVASLEEAFKMLDFDFVKKKAKQTKRPKRKKKKPKTPKE
jgi:DNA repair protein RadA/Sms